MKFVLSSRGSRGDVHPVIEIAAALRREGHDAVICVPRMFEGMVRSRGLEYSLYSEDSGQVMQELKSGWKAMRTALDWFSRSIEEQFEFLLRETADADALVTSVNEVAVPTVAELRGLPHFRVAYTPVLPGSQPPPLIPWQGLPGPVNRLLWYGVNGFTGFFIKKFINERRAALGMGPMPGTNRYFTGRSHTILTINRILAPPCPSWDGTYDYSYAGYCYGDIAGELEPRLAAFIQDGPPPVYIGFGSVSIDNARRFTAMILEAASLTGTRIVLGTGWTGLGSEDLPDHVFPVGNTGHAALFPRCAGIAHHGGSGTTHTAARAGVPQFIMPQIADQFYWGYRAYRLGVGPAPVRPRSVTVDTLCRVFRSLRNDPSYAANAQALADMIGAEDGVPAVVETIISSMQGSPSRKERELVR